MRKLIFLFLIVCTIGVQAQTMQYGTPDTANTTWNLSYEEFTSTHIPLEMTHPSFPGWECWLSYDGLLYVVLQCKQSWINEIFTYRRFNCVVLCLGLRE